MSPIFPHGDPRPTVAALLADPSVRGPVKAVLRIWSGRDPMDAAEDAGLLALALEREADERCRAAWTVRGRSMGDDGGGRP